jgi:hypothetical protein
MSIVMSISYIPRHTNTGDIVSERLTGSDLQQLYATKHLKAKCR